MILAVLSPIAEALLSQPSAFRMNSHDPDRKAPTEAPGPLHT